MEGLGQQVPAYEVMHVFSVLVHPLTRWCSWYTYSYLPLVWVSRDAAHPVIGTDTTNPTETSFSGRPGCRS